MQQRVNKDSEQEACGRALQMCYEEGKERPPVLLIAWEPMGQRHGRPPDPPDPPTPKLNATRLSKLTKAVKS